ncbi:helix-turn-helix domain-containing protein [Pedobacter sp. WC2501]|uniref:helix-turn-helix domain-containing protein n=1 Tax=Pedobacter sp. WC2501 TaxID=3461400 RepID=UPI004045264A
MRTKQIRRLTCTIGARLLISKDNIINIANHVGYQSETAFNRLFKHKFKKTPASFRRSHGR